MLNYFNLNRNNIWIVIGHIGRCVMSEDALGSTATLPLIILSQSITFPAVFALSSVKETEAPCATHRNYTIFLNENTLMARKKLSFKRLRLQQF